MAEQTSILCIGGAAIDRKYSADRPVLPGTSNPVHGAWSFGGVARNVAENLARLGVETELLSVVGRDEAGRALVEQLRQAGVGTQGVMIAQDGRTAEYIAVLDPDGSMAVAFADMAVLDRLTPTWLEPFVSRLHNASWLFADCNLPSETLAYLIGLARNFGSRLAIDAVSVAKSARLPDDLSGLDLLFVNNDEAAAMAGDEPELAEEAMDTLLARGVRRVVIMLGAGGCLAGDRDGVRHAPARAGEVIDVTGAGDAMVAGTLACLAGGGDWREAIDAGNRAAAATVASSESVIPAEWRG